jgi:TorA maturation chaperone TorD
MAHLIRIFVEEERPTLDEQRDFFKTHLKNWVWHFLDDIKKGSSMPYFHKIADIAERFLSIEKVYFS